jgi:hypothetical protein
MREAVFEPIPVELMALMERQDERHQWLRAAQRVGASLIVCQDAADVLAQLAAKPPDALLLPLGEREEESLLLCRAVLRRRTEQAPCPVFLYDRGARLVRSDQDARRVGAEALLPPMALPDLLRAVLAEVDLPLEAEVPEGWPQLPPAQPPAPTMSRPAHAAFDQDASRLPSRVGWRAPAAPPPQEAFTRWLKETLRAAQTQHYLAFLSLDLTSSAAQAQAALRACADRLREGSMAPDLSAESQAEAGALRDLLDDAWDVLAHPPRLAAYQRALAALKPPRARP